MNNDVTEKVAQDEVLIEALGGKKRRKNNNLLKAIVDAMTPRPLPILARVYKTDEDGTVFSHDIVGIENKPRVATAPKKIKWHTKRYYLGTNHQHQPQFYTKVFGPPEAQQLKGRGMRPDALAAMQSQDVPITRAVRRARYAAKWGAAAA